MRVRAAVVAAAAAIAGSCSSSAREQGVAMLPGAPPVPRELAARIEKAARAGGEQAPRYSNRLVLEPSPYLRQHAHNPVDWRPWGEEAFADARRLGRPILVSVGYSTCHWCHVMAEESFEDLEIARYLNQHYIAIKVDREERPDVDATYLKALEAMGVPGGWPLNVWLTPDGKPFFGSTYVPPRDGDRGVATGFATLLRRGRELVAVDRDSLARDTARVAAGMRALAGSPAAAGSVGVAELRRTVELFGGAFDAGNGGIAQRGQRNKFPAELPIKLFLRYARRTGDAEPRRMVELTLEKMMAGGIRDHLGGGFHRYATDPQWRVPHFEKMLYDNALLVVAYLEAFQATGREDFAEVAREILAFATRDLAESSWYASAIDADSRGADGRSGEGLYYTWTPAEVEAALGPGQAADLVRAWYGVSRAGNFEGRSVLAVSRPLGEVAAALGLEEARARDLLTAARPRLLAAREKRPRPHRDGKLVTGWNALMVSALVRAAHVLEGGGDPARGYLSRAGELARAVSSPSPGGLARVPAPGRPPVRILEDRALVIAALLDLFEATGDPSWFERAGELDRELARDFEDPRGGFHATPADGDPRLLRDKSFEDGVVPSGNSVMALNLLRLAEMTGRDEYRARADRLLAAAFGQVGAEPDGSPDLMTAVDWRTDAPLEIALVAPSGAVETLAPFRAVLARTFVPNRVVLAGSEEEVARLAGVVPWLADKKALGGRATAYVCLKGLCKLPARDPETFAKQIAAAQPLP